MDFIYNEETGCFEEHKEPYAVMEFPTKEDYEAFEEMVAFYKANHKEED